MTNICPLCGAAHPPHTRFCPTTGSPLTVNQHTSQPVVETQGLASSSSEAMQDRQLFSPFLYEGEELQETFYLGRQGILKPTRVWITVTNHRVLGLVTTHYFFQEAAEGAKILHTFSFPIHHQRFEEPALIELILMLAVCGIAAFFTFGATLVLFLFWWVRVYRRKGFVMDGYVFLCSGHKEAAWQAIRLISDLNEKYARSHGGAFISA